MQFSSKKRWIVSFIALLSAFLLGLGFKSYVPRLELNKTSVTALEKNSHLSNLAILNRVLLQVSQSYVDPGRIDPNSMLSHALYNIEQVIPEVLVHFDRDIDLNPSTVEIQVKSFKKAFFIGDVDTTWKASYKLKSILEYIDTYVKVPEGTQQKVEYAAIDGMLTTLDPHTVFLPPKNFKEMRTQTGGKFGGIGVEVTPQDGRLMIVSALLDSPAEKAGIKAKDIIVQINDQSTLNMTMDDAVELLRGEIGTSVDLYIKREGLPNPKKFTLRRAEIKLKSVIAKPLPDKIAYIRITNFQANTYLDMIDKYQELLKNMHGINGMVLDLRDNPGGLLDQAVKVANLFLRKGPIVTTVGLGNKVLSLESAKDSSTLPNFPLAILINAGTASASEIVAGALKNHGRGVTIGDTSFGKGSVQILHEFADHSAIKLTVAQYLTPGNISIQGYGITPDIHTQSAEVDSEYIDLFPPKKVLRESKLSSHLTNSASGVISRKPFDMIYLARVIPSDSKDPLDDFEISLAYRLLSESEPRKWLVAPFSNKILNFLKTIVSEEDKKIAATLKARGIDWESRPKNSLSDTAATPPKVQTSVEVLPSKLISVGNRFSIKVTAKNLNNFPLYRVYGSSNSPDPLFDDLEFLFGKLAPGETRYWIADVPVDRSSQPRTSNLTFDFTSNAGKLQSNAISATAQLAPIPIPKFAVTATLDDRSGDGYMSPGEDGKLVVRVTNVGKGASDKTRILLRSKTNSHLFLKSGRESAFKLSPGSSKTFAFDFSLNDDGAEGDETKLRIEIFDKASQRFSNQILPVPIRPKRVDALPHDDFVIVKTPTTLNFVAHPIAENGSSLEKKALVQLPVGTILHRIATVGDYSKVVIYQQDTAVNDGNQGDPAAAPVDNSSEAVAPKVDDSSSDNRANKESDSKEESGAVDRATNLPMTAFIATKYVAETAKRAPLFTYTENTYQFASIKLTSSSGLTSASTMRVHASISGKLPLKDYVVFNSYERGDSTRHDKIVYGALSGRSAEIDFEVKLQNGLNLIELQVRDVDDMPSSEQLILMRAER